MSKRKLFALALIILPVIAFGLHFILERRPFEFKYLAEGFALYLLGFICGAGLVLLLVFISQERALNCVLEEKKADNDTVRLKKQLDKIYKKYIKGNS